MPTVDFAPGGYRFIPSVFQYSAGVAALPGFHIERVRFQTPMPVSAGFQRIRELLADAGRPPESFCACELRSPAPFSEGGFRTFNEGYVAELRRWGIMADGPNPVARSNICPELSAPVEPCFHAFCFTVPGADSALSFVASGSGEVPEGRSNFRDHIIRRGDVSPAGFKEKVRYVVAEMEARMASLGCRWPDATATQIYTVHDIHPLLPEEILGRGNGSSDVTWHYCRPPVIELEFEMDCRAIHHERIIAG
jgi:hypothetical protein